MTDPRNIAHDKKVQQEKKHHGKEISPGADKVPQPGRKPHMQSNNEEFPATPDADEEQPVQPS